MRKSSLMIASMALAALAVTGCGGGGGGSAATDAPPVVDNAKGGSLATPAVAESSTLMPACTNCGAVSSTQYAGTNVGVWGKKNTSTVAENVPVSLSGLRGQDVMLILTNETPADVALPTIPLHSEINLPKAFSSEISAVVAPATAVQDEKAAVAQFNKDGWKQLVAAPQTTARSSMITAESAPAVKQAVVGTRVFKYQDGTNRTTALQKEVTASDGMTIRFWVETSEFGVNKITMSHVDELVSAFTGTGGIYDMLTDTVGPMWGAHNYSELIASNTHVIDIVMLNFVKDSTPYGEVGYFYALNNFKKTSASNSNESLSLYLDTETLYLGGANGMKAEKMVMAHEGTHMANFYRRGVTMGADYQYDLWLEEMTAMMMEDAASSKIDASYNPTRDIRFPSYMSKGSYNCPLLDFTTTTACDSYSVSGSFGGFLLRQMGMPFFKTLLNAKTVDSVAAMNASIKTYRPASGMGYELRKFAIASIPAFSTIEAPTGLDYPDRTDGRYVIPGFNAQAYQQYRALPTTLPTTLKAYASFPVLRKAITGTFTETVRVPAGTTLSVVISK